MNILFVGNSYTFFNDLPNMVYNLAINSGYEVSVDSVTRGGRFLYENLGDDEYAVRLSELAESKRYDILVLQEQSHFALKDYAKFEECIGILKERISAERTVLYSTWGRKTGSPLLSEYGLTSREMTDKLYGAYCTAAKKHSCEITPVGLCFAHITEQYPEIELYNDDKSHPNEAGSSLGAIAFFKRFFGRLPDDYSSLPVGKEALAVIIDTVEKFL